MPSIPFKDIEPVLGKGVWIAPTGWVIGKCEIGEDVSVFFGAVLRGDINRIIVGRGSNIQDNAILHTSHGLGDCVVGRDVTVGHCAILHGCTVNDRCIIGMGSTILDQAVIEEGCIIGANSLVSMKTVIPANSLAFGTPAKVIRELTEKERKELDASARSYRETAQVYQTSQFHS